MGILDNSTTYIFLDTVLTDIGRKLLAKNDGSFEIVKFACGDDEIDYTIIEKFGITDGKTKIQNHTPIMEAITNENLAQKYKLVSLTDQTFTKFPKLSLASVVGGSSYSQADTGELVGDVITLNQSIRGQNSVTVGLKQSTTESTVDSELVDQSYVIELDNRFLYIENDLPVFVNRMNKATYIISRNSGDTTLGSQASFGIRARNLTNSDFTTYGTVSDKNTIRSYAKVTGVNSGAVKEFQVNLSRSSS